MTNIFLVRYQKNIPYIPIPYLYYPYPYITHAIHGKVRRKTHAGLQLILIIFLMRVLGLENLATSDPHSRVWPQSGHYTADHSYVCRWGQPTPIIEAELGKK